MLKHLVNLADYLDQKKLNKLATIVDTFIAQAAPMDDRTWDEDAEFPTYHGEMETIDVGDLSEEPEVGLPKIKLSDQITLDLEKHPLGQRILDYVTKSFEMADDGITEIKEMHARDTASIIDLMSKYDEALTYNKSQAYPLEPIQVKDMLNQALSIGYSLYHPKGHLDMKDVISSIQNLYKHYEDYYLEEVLRQPSKSTPQYDVHPNNVVIPELSEEERQKLWNQQDQYIGNLGTQSWLEETEKSESPGKYERRKTERRKEDQRAYPEEWHEVLFPK